MKNIFPKEFITKSIEFHRYQSLRRSRMIYSILLIGLIIAATLLPIIRIDLYTEIPGMIRPEKERNIIKSPINGTIAKVNIRENLEVNQGDTLIILDDKEITLIIQGLESKINALNIEVKDLNYLINSKKYNRDSIKSKVYLSQLQEHILKSKSLKDKWIWDQKAFSRQNQLYKKGVIARQDFEISMESRDFSETALNYYLSKQKRIWQDRLQKVLSEIRILKAKQLEYEKEKSLHYIIAPLDGTIQNLKGIEKDNYLYTSSSVAHISPKTDLLIECYVDPSDIGMLKKNQPVSFQIDAFNFHDWGLATGKIIEISDDNTFIDKLPMFKVICSMNERKLRLNDHIEGQLKKGMTLKALFFIKNRSLFQLLFDRLSDWY